MLVRGAGYDRVDGADRVRAVQRHLRAAGVDPGPVDGRFGPLTEAAVRRFQSAHGLAADGIVGPRTRLVLRAPVALARVPASVGPGARSLCARCSGIYARSASIPAPSTGASVPGRRTRFSGSRRLAAWRSTESSVRTPRVDFRGRTGRRPGLGTGSRSRLAEHADATAGAVEHPPTATTPGPAHRRPPIVATPAKKPGRSPDGLDPLGMAAVIALIAIAGLLLVAGGVGWRRRRARRMVPASQLAPVTAAWPAAPRADARTRVATPAPWRGDRPTAERLARWPQRTCRARRSDGAPVRRAPLSPGYGRWAT